MERPRSTTGVYIEQGAGGEVRATYGPVIKTHGSDFQFMVAQGSSVLRDGHVQSGDVQAGGTLHIGQRNGRLITAEDFTAPVNNFPHDVSGSLRSAHAGLDVELTPDGRSIAGASLSHAEHPHQAGLRVFRRGQ